MHKNISVVSKRNFLLKELFIYSQNLIIQTVMTYRTFDLINFLYFQNIKYLCLYFVYILSF